MKLRYVWGSEPAPEYGENVARKVKVLQQWWEGAKIKKEYEHLAPGSIIPWDGISPLMTYEPHGEWRDVPIEAD